MTQQLINIGTSANDGTGDSLRTAFGKINNNFSTLFNTSVSTGPQGSVQYRATANVLGIALLDSTYVAIAATNKILTSTDGMMWTNVVSPSTSTPRAITTDGTKFTITGDNGLVMTSTDGSTWTVVTTGTTARLTSIAYDATNSVTIAVGESGTILKSTDGSTTWTTLTTSFTDDLNSVTWVETLDMFVAVGDNGAIIGSTAGGASWAQVISPVATNLNSVTSKLNDVVVAGDNGVILTSPNTLLWSQQTSGTTANLNGITVATVGTVSTAIAVGDTGTIITSPYDTSLSFNAWTSTAYPSPTTVDLYNAITIDTTAWVTGYAGTLFDLGTGTWSNSGIPLGIEGDATFTFDPITHLLSIDADIVPQTSNTYSLGTDTNRFDAAYFNTTGITIGNVTATETSANTLSLLDPSGNLANLEVNGLTATDITTANLSASLANIDLANIGNLESANANIGNLTVANLTLTTLTITDLSIPGNIDANNANFTGTVTANDFIGDGSQLTNLPMKAAGTVGSVQIADVNLDLSSSANLSFDTATNTLSTGNITASDISATQVTATSVFATTLHGEGANITGLPVTSIVAGTDITVSNVGGTWTIASTASSGGGGGSSTTNPSHGPINSIQYAGPNGTFASSSTLQFDSSVNELTLTGNVTAHNFNGNVHGGTGDFTTLTADAVTADTINGNLHGNVFGGNVDAENGTFSGTLSADNLSITGTFNVEDQVSNRANIGNISIWRSNIHEFGSGNDNFVIDSARSNIVIQGANIATLNVDAPFVMIRGGNVAGNAVGGNVIIESGDGGSIGKAGTLTLKGGQGGTGNDGGNIDILGGNSGTGGDGGTISIISGVTYGDPSTIHGANLYLQSGNTVNEDAGTLIIQGGNAVGTNLYGGNVRITAGTGSLANGNVYIGNTMWPSAAGTENQVLTADGTGNAQWKTVNSGDANSINISNIVNGTSNVEIVNTNGPVTVGVAGTPNVATFTQAGLETGNVKTSHLILGNSTFTASDTWWAESQTSTTAPLQVLFQMPAAGQNSVDFKVIAYDVPASNKQSTMITTVTYGTSTSYSVYAITMINTMIATFAVDQSGGFIRLLASPTVNYLVRYTIVITKY